MNNSSPRFWSYRTLWGLLTGVGVALVFIIFFQQSGFLTPTLSLIFAAWISKLSQPKHIAALGAIIAVPAGCVSSIQIVLRQIQNPDLAAVIGAFFFASIFFIVYVLVFAFTGFFYGQLLKLYRRGALF